MKTTKIRIQVSSDIKANRLTYHTLMRKLKEDLLTQYIYKTNEQVPVRFLTSI